MTKLIRINSLTYQILSQHGCMTNYLLQNDMWFYPRFSKFSETLFQLRFTCKQLDKMAAKAEKEQQREVNKVKKVGFL